MARKKKRITISTKPKYQEIIERLERIEKALKEYKPQQFIPSFCNHEWKPMEGTSDFPMWECKRCGAIKGEPNYTTTDG